MAAKATIGTIPLYSPKRSETLYTKLRNVLTRAEERGCDPARHRNGVQSTSRPFALPMLRNPELQSGAE
jgi:hypothetical protein